MNEGLKGAYGKAVEAAKGFEGFVKEHPIFFTVVALGVLCVLCPEVLAWLGFEEVGILEGEIVFFLSSFCLFWEVLLWLFGVCLCEGIC